jgi:hypothetical protein
MLVITLPINTPNGRCRINGLPHEYETDYTDWFKFRDTDASAVWDRRRIRHVEDRGMMDCLGGGQAICVTLICDDDDAEVVPNVDRGDGFTIFSADYPTGKTV